jgi:hypothetical protein
VEVMMDVKVKFEEAEMVGDETTMALVDQPIRHPSRPKDEIFDGLSKCLDSFGPRDV